MTSINSLTAQQTQSSYSAKGFTGLMSGMNTEEVVEKMTQNIQNRIDRIVKEETRNTWKQEAYRSVITSITNFEDKYFSFSNPKTNLLRTGFYNNISRTPQGANAKKISVTTNQGTGDANFEITSISQLARRASYVGSTGIDSSTLQTGKVNFSDYKINLVDGKHIEVMYNNTRYQIDIDTSKTAIGKGKEAEMMAKVLNQAMANIRVQGSQDTLNKKVKFEATGDNKLKLVAKDPKDKNKFSISGGQDDTLNALGLKKGAEGSAKSPIVGNGKVAVTKVKHQSLEGREIDLDLNGQVKKLIFSKEENNEVMKLTSNEERVKKIAQIMNKKAADLFGANKISITADAGTIKMKAIDKTATLSVTSPNKDTIGSSGMFPISDKTTNRLDMNTKIGNIPGLKPTVEHAAGKTNMDNLYKININGREFTFQGRATVAQVLKAINEDKDSGVDITYLNTTNKFSIMAKEYGENGKLKFHDVSYNGKTGNFAKMLFGKIADDSLSDADKGIEKGQDLKMTIRYRGEKDDIEIVRNSNVVNIDNIGFEAKATFDKSSEKISFATSQDPTEAVKAIKQMAEDYNKILDEVNKLITTKRAGFKNKKMTDRFEPLTEAQRKKMTAKEIEDWEKKAKEGILFGDPVLRNLMSDLRFAISSAVGRYGLSKDIGISTASSYSGNGKMIIDEKKLAEALKKDPNKVMNIFNAPREEAINNNDPKLSGGIAVRLKNILESYAKSVGTEKGRLVNIAGIKGNATTKGNLIERLQNDLAKKREALETKLKAKRERYQARFTMLERYMAKMQRQSSWLMQQ